MSVTSPAQQNSNPPTTMASASRLKQSSMDSFLLPQPPPNPNPTHPAASAVVAAAASDYEQVRRENIRRNSDFFQKLGIVALCTPKPKPTRRHPKPRPTSSVPLRRSTRKRGPPPHSSEDDGSDATDEAPEPSDLKLVDSSVFQYACDASAGHKDPSTLSSPAIPESPSSPIMGFRIVGNSFRDPSLTKIYSMDVRSLKERRFLVAAGGHGGFISIYGGGGGDGGEGNFGEDDELDGISGRGTEGPLMSWKGSRSWVSGVMFAEDNPMLLISSSNDGSIVVWDIKKQPTPTLSSASWSPPVVAESMGLHSGGIFSMDRLSCSIATASKDSSVGISRLTSAGELVAERSVSGHHSGVIRGICFREKDTLADCGADGRICVLDTRLPQPCALTIESQHSAGVNTVQWCRANGSLLLSASKDPALLLYDIRSITEPLHRLQGHAESSARTCYQIYRPTFVDGGKAIATPGQGSRKISLYRADEGTLVSRGAVGYDANLVMFSGDDDGHPRLWAAGRHIDQLCRLPQPRI